MSDFHRNNDDDQDEIKQCRALLGRVYDQFGNHLPAEKRHQMTPGLRDDIRDYLKTTSYFDRSPVCETDCDGLRQEYERLRSLTHKLIEGRGAIVSSADCSPMELAFARKENRFVVDADGMGFVVRLKEWRERAEGAV